MKIFFNFISSFPNSTTASGTANKYVTHSASAAATATYFTTAT